MVFRKTHIPPCIKNYEEEEYFEEEENSQSMRVEKSVQIPNSLIDTNDLNHVNMENYLEEGKIEHCKLKLALCVGTLAILTLFLVVILFIHLFL